MERAVIYLQGCDGTKYVNILADDMKKENGYYLFFYDGRLVAIFIESVVAAAWLSIKDFKKA